MKTKILAALVIVSSLCSFMMQAKTKIIFFGDSITEAGTGPEGYITRLNQILTEKNRGGHYDLVGAGISGNKVYDLYLRLQEDVLDKKPDAVVVWIGVNDVWHKKTSLTGTDADKFERFYTALIKKLKDRNITVFLCTPGAIGEKWDCTNELDGDLNKYAGIIRNLSQKNNCTLIDLRQAFLNYSKRENPDNKDRGVLTTDGVHLNTTGNRFVAETMYAVLSQHLPQP
jgi:isoamyl acetate esterase